MRERLSIVCAGSWLGRPQDVLPRNRQALDISLDDSKDTICVETHNVVEGKPYKVRDASGHWTCTMQSVRCSDCKAFLGVRAKEIIRNEDTSRADSPSSITIRCAALRIELLPALNLCLGD